MPSPEETYDRLAAAATGESDDGAIRVRATYEPGAGAGAKVSPPTYLIEDRDSPYLIEERWGADGEPHKVVLLDSRQAQANRCEEAFQVAIDAGQLRLPHIVLEVQTHGRPVPLTSLTVPHRSRDAYFRDAEDQAGVPFDQTDPGRALAEVTAADATGMYSYSPADLVYGVWDSHRDLRLATRFPRVYTSELIGWDALVGLRAAGRFDLVTSGGAKVAGGNHDWQRNPKGSSQLSELGLGAIPPTTRDRRNNAKPGGTTVKMIERTATVSFPGLARIRVGNNADAARAARAVLAALALLGDRLAFSGAVFIRSGCDLVLADESLTWVGRMGATEALDLDPEGARQLFDLAVARAEAAGVTWVLEPVRLRPQAKLQQVIDEAYLSAPAEDE